MLRLLQQKPEIQVSRMSEQSKLAIYLNFLEKIIQTCSLQCVQQHKKELNCSGKRDPTEFVFKKTMNNRLLLRDYRFLEDAGRKTFAWERILRDYSPDAQKSSPYYEGREALTRYVCILQGLTGVYCT